MRKPIVFEVVDENEPADGEGVISADELYADIMEGSEQAARWAKGEGTLRVTEFVDGERIGPKEMTKEEFDAQQVAITDQVAVKVS